MLLRSTRTGSTFVLMWTAGQWATSFPTGFQQTNTSRATSESHHSALVSQKWVLLQTNISYESNDKTAIKILDKYYWTFKYKLLNTRKCVLTNCYLQQKQLIATQMLFIVYLDHWTIIQHYAIKQTHSLIADCRWMTHIILRLKPDMRLQTRTLAARFNDIHPSLLLFLHRLDQITVENKVLGNCSLHVFVACYFEVQLQLHTAKSQYWLHKAGASPEHWQFKINNLLMKV